MNLSDREVGRRIADAFRDLGAVGVRNVGFSNDGYDRAVVIDVKIRLVPHPPYSGVPTEPGKNYTSPAGPGFDTGAVGATRRRAAELARREHVGQHTPAVDPYTGIPNEDLETLRAVAPPEGWPAGVAEAVSTIAAEMIKEGRDPLGDRP